MSLKPTNYSRAVRAALAIGGLILFAWIAVAGAQAADSNGKPRYLALTVGLPQVVFNMVSLSALTAHGQTVGDL